MKNEGAIDLCFILTRNAIVISTHGLVSSTRFNLELLSLDPTLHSSNLSHLTILHDHRSSQSFVIPDILNSRGLRLPLQLHSCLSWLLVSTCYKITLYINENYLMTELNKYFPLKYICHVSLKRLSLFENKTKTTV